MRSIKKNQSSTKQFTDKPDRPESHLKWSKSQSKKTD